MPKNARSVSLALLLPALAGCAGILGIEPATFDGSGGAPSTGGATGSGGVAASSGGTNDANDAGGNALCKEYCASVAKNCSTPFEIYTSLRMCISVCEKLEPGTRGDTTGNSVACRMHYAESAGILGEKAANCSAAGPGGDGICGSNCESFCTITDRACTGSRQAYPNVTACEAACATVPDNQTYNDSIQGGNSVECRLYHSTAATIDPALHCPHTIIGIPGPCAAVLTPGN